MKKLSMLLLIALFATSCATTFSGDAHTTPKQCVRQCAEWGMEIDGMVAMGEYSSACICKVKRSSGQVRTEAGGNAGAAVAVQEMIKRMSQQNMHAM